MEPAIKKIICLISSGINIAISWYISQGFIIGLHGDRKEREKSKEN